VYTTATTKVHCCESSQAVPARPFGKTRLVTRDSVGRRVGGGVLQGEEVSFWAEFVFEG